MPVPSDGAGAGAGLRDGERVGVERERRGDGRRLRDGDHARALVLPLQAPLQLD